MGGIGDRRAASGRSGFHFSVAKPIQWLTIGHMFGGPREPEVRPMRRMDRYKPLKLRPLHRPSREALRHWWGVPGRLTATVQNC